MGDSGLRPTLGERVAHQGARVLAALPPAAQVRLSGKPAICIDGQVLAPEMQLVLALLERRGETQPDALTPEASRRQRRRLAAICAGRGEPVGAVTDLEIPA